LTKDELKTKLKPYIKPAIIYGIVLIAIFVAIDDFIMPSFVEANEVIVPNVVGLKKDKAIEMIEELNLTPIVVGSRYDGKYKINEVIFQKPYAGTDVKENRNIYIHISGGEPVVKMPELVGKTLRDATVNLGRLGLFAKVVEEVTSELPNGTIVEQGLPVGSEIQKGDSIRLKISVGPELGMVRVPNLIAKSEKEAVKILDKLSLKLGIKTYIASPTLLPNTIISQFPMEDELITIGDSVNVVISKSNRD
jgi:serine/threonine-protein kinase